MIPIRPTARRRPPPTLTVLDHSNASFSSDRQPDNPNDQLRQRAERGDRPSQNFTIYNRAANTSAAYTANMKLTGFTTTRRYGIDHEPLDLQRTWSAGNGNTYTASLNTSNYTTTGTKTITMSASQLADDSSLPGAGNNNNGGITITLQGNVGNATADKSNSQSSFGTALTAPVAQNASYANLESTVTATTGSGGYGMVGSTATILAGTNSSGSSQTVSMQWRTQTQAERTSPMLISDVVRLSGMTLDGTSQTSPFVLQMDLQSLLAAARGRKRRAVGSRTSGFIWAWLNPSTDQWENAIDGNYRHQPRAVSISELGPPAT